METLEEFEQRAEAWLHVADHASDATAAHIHAWIAEEREAWDAG